MRTRLLPLIVTLAVLGAGACKNDKKEVSASYCDAVATVFNYETGGPDGGPDAIKATYTKALQDLKEPFATLTEEGPNTARAVARRWRAAFVTSSTKGTDQTDRLLPIESELIGEVRAGCDWPQRNFSAADFAFSDVPSTLPAGRSAIALKNTANDSPHLILFVRVKDGVTKSADELAKEFGGEGLAPDLEEGFAGGAFAFPGKSANGLVTLKPGRYVYLCPLPVDFGDPSAGDHAGKGMRGEIEVA